MGLEFFKVTLREIPSILFAHKYRAAADSWLYLTDPGLVEITFLEQGDITYLAEDGSAQSFTAPCILADTHSRYCRVQTTSELHCHFTFSFRACDLPVLLNEEEAGRASVLPEIGSEGNTVCILPRHVPEGASCEKIARNIKRIISARQSILAPDHLQTAGCVFEILAELGRCAAEQAERGAQNTFINPYTAKAIRYVGDHIEEKIRVQEVAEALEISYGYLSRVFHADTGSSLIRYINEAKVRRVKELIIAKNVTLEEAGAIVGIHDIKYLSRIFKKYSGTTVSDYKRRL